MKTFENESQEAVHSGKMKRTRLGVYTVVLSLAVLAVLVVLNALLSLLPGKVTAIDVSSTDMYTISDSSARAVKKIKQDVTVYYLKESGAEDNVQLETFLERYTSLNSHIRLKTVDPVLQPGFTNNYTDETLYNYSIIVESDKRYRVINFTDLYYFEGGISMDDENLEYYRQYYAEAYGTDLPLYFDGQAKLTSALDFVTTDTLTTVYTLTGHGESALSNTLQAALRQNNLDIVSDLSLTLSGVPENCDMLVIFAPQTDLSEGETAMLLSYLRSGGNVLLITMPGVSSLPNLLSVTAAFGMEAKDGIVIEGDSNYFYPNYPHYLLPGIESNDLTAGMGNLRVMFPMAHGILQTAAQGITLTPLFSTTDSSYTVATNSTTSEKTADSVSGPLMVGVIATSEQGGKLCWFSSAHAFTDTFDITGGNKAYFLEVTDHMCERSSILSSLDPISLSDPTLTVSAGSALLWSAVFVLVIPGALLIAGLVIWLKRRKK